MTQSEILESMSKIDAARRGQITEQWYTVRGGDGTERRQGPYYVWTRYDGGEKRTSRVRGTEVERARRELEKGRELDRLVGEFWRNAEAEAAGTAEKKTARTAVSKPARNCAKPSRSSGRGRPPEGRTPSGSRRR